MLEASRDAEKGERHGRDAAPWPGWSQFHLHAARPTERPDAFCTHVVTENAMFSEGDSEEDSGKHPKRKHQGCRGAATVQMAQARAALYPPASKRRSGRSCGLPRAHSSRHAFFDLMIAAVQCELSVPPACLSKSWGNIRCCMQHGTRILSRAKTARAIRN